MRTILWTQNAKNDLTTIVSFYNKRNGNSAYSKKLVNAVKRTLQLLKTNPFLGIKVEENPNYRVLIIKDYKVFYKVFTDKIEIRLVWDSRQNPDKVYNRQAN